MAPRNEMTKGSQSPPLSFSNGKATPTTSASRLNAKDRGASSPQPPFGGTSGLSGMALHLPEYDAAQGASTVEGGFNLSRGRQIVSNDRISVQISGRGWFIGAIVAITRFVKKCTGSDMTVGYLGQSERFEG